MTYEHGWVIGLLQGVSNLFETESNFLVQIHAKGYHFDTHTSEIKIYSICLQLRYH